MERFEKTQDKSLTDTESNDTLKSNNETIETPESYGSKLCEYLTGLKISDPAIVERLEEDQLRIRTKYSLPTREKLQTVPREYEEDLRALARLYSVKIRGKDDIEGFFAAHPNASGAHFQELKSVFLDLETDTIQNYKGSLNILEHELIHAMQTEHSPGMPIEVMEYEAYVANANLSHLNELSPEERPETIDVFFDYLVGASVSHWYQEEAEKKGAERKDQWYRPNPYESDLSA